MAVVLNDFRASLPHLHMLFLEFKKISALDLNVEKTLFIPLWKYQSVHGVTTAITDVCPAWHKMKVDSKGKYLGLVIGPGSGDHSWDAPVRKFNKKLNFWASQRLGLLMGAICFNTFL
eukprot:2743051-Karenia_brevis.AAC.1